MKHLVFLSEEQYKKFKKEKIDPVIDLTTEFLEFQVKVLEEFINRNEKVYKDLINTIDENHSIWMKKVVKFNKEDKMPCDKKKKKRKNKKK